MRTYAFEGINGSGKSRVIETLSLRLSHLGSRTTVAKVSGLGEGTKMACLKRILDFRESQLRSGRLTPRQEIDQMQDRLFRLANRIQVREYLNSIQRADAQIALLDRTPLMSWAYTFSLFENNPYLNEVAEEALRLTSYLNLNGLFLLQISPIEMYARVISRSVDRTVSVRDQIQSMLRLLDAPKKIKEDVHQRSIDLIRINQSATYKPVRIWDFMPYEHVCRQIHDYQEVVDHACNTLSIPFHLIDASQPADKCATDIQGLMQ